MPRPLRVEYEGAWYHVMNRGANRQDIFINNQQREIFLSLLESVSEQFYVQIHAYCLMGNHYHLLVHTPLANLSKVMRYLDGVYTQTFNRMMKRDGSLFRGRYKAILIEADTYLLQVSKYIHLNPVVAKLCQYPHEYEWSSYREYLALKPGKSWLYISEVLAQLSGTNLRKKYADYVAEKNDAKVECFYQKMQLPAILGREKFIDNQLSKLEENYKRNVSTDLNRLSPVPCIELIMKIVSSYFQLDINSLKDSVRGRGKQNQARKVAMYIARHIGQLTHAKIAEHFTNINRVAVSSALKRCSALIEKDKNFKQHVDVVITILKNA